MHFSKLDNALPPFSVRGESLCTKPSLQFWSQTASASSRGFFRGVFAKQGCTKPADVLAYLSSSVIIYRRFTAGTQREVQVPLSRPNPAQFVSKEKTQLYSHCWMWVRAEPESPGSSPREEWCQAATLWPMSSSTATFCFCKSRNFFFKRRFC